MNCFILSNLQVENLQNLIGFKYTKKSQLELHLLFE